MASVLALQVFMLRLGFGPQVQLWALLVLPGSRYFAFAFLTPPLFLLVHKWPITRQSWPKTIPFYLIIAVAYIWIFSVVRWLLLPPYDFGHGQFVQRHLWDVKLIVFQAMHEILAVYLLVVAIAHAYELYKVSHQRELEQMEAARALAQSELETLRGQLHPHFVFNTLQGVATLTEKHPRRAQEMILVLARLMRSVLKHKSGDLITLGQELQFVSDYLSLEQMRLGDRLVVNQTVAAEAMHLLVPQMIVQPLVENAVLHGAANSTSGGWVELNSKVSEQRLTITVRNNTSAHRREGTGVGLKNTRLRLHHLYGDDATLDFQIEQSGTALATVELPAVRAYGVDAC